MQQSIGKRLRLYYYKDPKGNFGDDLNVWLWSRLLPNIVDVENAVLHPDSATASYDAGPLFIGIGTLLNTRVPQAPKKIVFGAGTGYRSPAKISGEWDFYCVRGPLTAKALGLDQKYAITDPAILVRNFEWPTAAKIYGYSFIPHHLSLRGSGLAAWKGLCSACDVEFIDPRKSPSHVISKIAQSRGILTESLHGAVVADALRIPWQAVRFSGAINEFKWRDWCMSIGVTYDPVSPPILLRARENKKSIFHVAGNIIKDMLNERAFREAVDMFSPVLSKDCKVEELTSIMCNKIDALRSKVVC